MNKKMPMPDFSGTELEGSSNKDIRITWKKTAKIPPIEVTRNQRIIDRVREDLNLPDTITNEEILATKGNSAWQWAAFGIAKDDLANAVSSEMKKLLKAFSFGRRK